MSTRPTISDISVTDISPKVPDKYKKLLPSVLHPQHLEMRIDGVSNAVSNALRRTISCELPVLHLSVEYENIITDDRFIIPEMIIKRLRMIPIDQSIPQDTKFRLDITNTTHMVMDVKSSEIVQDIRRPGKSPLKPIRAFNETFTLLTLRPGASINIKNIVLATEYGYNSGYGMCALACNVASIALDQVPMNNYTNEGVPAAMSNPRSWKLSFNTNGSMDAKQIVIAACDNIIMRVNNVHDMLYTVENVGDEYILNIDGETDTIGNLFMRTISDLFPDIRAVSYSTASVGRRCTIRIRCEEDINTVYEAAINYIKSVYETIRIS